MSIRHDCKVPDILIQYRRLLNSITKLNRSSFFLI